MKQNTSSTRSILFVLFAMCTIAGFAQEQDQKTNFSVQEAIDYAWKHNENYLNAELDVQAADYRNKEYTGIGLPQISGNADLKDYLSIPTSLIPAEIFGGQPGTYAPVKFGTKYNATMGISISQIIFNSDYIVGLQAAKELKVLSQKNLKRTKVDIEASVTKAYFTAVITNERLKIINANIDRVKKLFDDTKALNIAGFAEKLDVDRLEYTYNGLLTEKEKLERFIILSKDLLKFQMGYVLKNDIVLTDEIKAEMLIDIDKLSETKVVYEARPDFDALQSQLNINNIELKRYRYAYLPSLAAYGSFQKQAQRTEFDVFNIDQPWFGIGLVGLTLNVPIWSSGQKYYRVQQSKINVAKTMHTVEYTKKGIDIEISTAAMQYKNALAALETQKKNKTLAQSIFDASETKYNAGVGPNLDVIYAQAALKEAEINFLSAVYDLILAKTDYLKATGTLVK